MTGYKGVFTTLPLLMALAVSACASSVKPQPVDPVKEQLTILQKQLLELQNTQNETRRKLDEQTSATEALSNKVQSLESQRSAPPPQLTPKPAAPATVAPEKKKPAKKSVKKKKKKKPVRRQVP